MCAKNRTFASIFSTHKLVILSMTVLRKGLLTKHTEMVLDPQMHGSVVSSEVGLPAQSAEGPTAGGTDRGSTF